MHVQLDIRQITFSFASQFNFVLKLSSLGVTVKPLQFTIRYPPTELGELIRERHPKTMILDIDWRLADFVLDLTFEKLLLLVRLVTGITSMFSTEPEPKVEELDMSHMTFSDSMKKEETERHLDRLDSARLLAEPTKSRRESARPSILRVQGSEALAAVPPDAVEKLRFHLNLSIQFRIEKFALIYALPTNGKVIKYSLGSVTIRAFRSLFVVAIKQVVLDLVSEGKLDPLKPQNEEILNFPSVS